MYKVNTLKTLKAHLGLLLIAVPIPLLLIPAATPIGGAPGLSVLLHLLTGFAPGLLLLGINLACFLFASFVLGWRSGAKTLYAAFFLSAAVEVTHRLAPHYAIADPAMQWLAQAAASVLLGLGLAMAMEEGFAPAGTAALAASFQKLWRWPVVASLWGMDFGISAGTALAMNFLAGLRTFFGACVMYLVMLIYKKYVGTR